ncbi:hypothetical protein FSHL1_006066 [Fusarium sambucinum]
MALRLLPRARKFPFSQWHQQGSRSSPLFSVTTRLPLVYLLPQTVLAPVDCTSSFSTFTALTRPLIPQLTPKPQKLLHTTSQSLKMDSFQQQQQQQPRGACYSCGSTAHQARDCPTKGPAKCYNCGGEGHMSRDCTEPMKDNKSCYKCGQPGHISRDCPMSGGSGQATECYKCGEIGHIARNCQKSSYGNNYGGGGGFQQGGAGKTCYSCGGFGHMSRECVNGMKCYNCGESGHYSRDCPKESAGGEKICYKCQQPGHVQSQCPGN